MEKDNGDVAGELPKGEVCASGIAMFGGSAQVPTGTSVIREISTEDDEVDDKQGNRRDTPILTALG